MRTGPLSNSKNAVSFSSARTTKRFPSPRCASVIQIVRPLESIAETQPQLQPALLRIGSRHSIRDFIAFQRRLFLCLTLRQFYRRVRGEQFESQEEYIRSRRSPASARGGQKSVL